MSVTMAPTTIESLPNKCLLQIFSHLDAHDLARCSCVSKVWQAIASHDILWRRLIPKHYLPKGITNIQKYVNTQAVQSMDQMIQRIEMFVNKVSFNQKGRVKCICLFSPWPYNISVEISSLEACSKQKPDIEETLIFMKEVSFDKGRYSEQTSSDGEFSQKITYYFPFENKNEEVLYSSQISKILDNRECEIIKERYPRKSTFLDRIVNKSDKIVKTLFPPKEKVYFGPIKVTYSVFSPVGDISVSGNIPSHCLKDLEE